MKTNRFSSLFVGLMICLGMHAQMGKLYDADKQLSSSFTSQVYLDRDGFVWVATRNGLNKYDGYQFHIIKKEEQADNGMASNYVNCIAQDHNGLFYLGMYGAMQTYDGNRFRTVEVTDLNGAVVPSYVTCILVRKSGEVLVGSSGHGVLKMTDPSHAQQLNGALRDIHTVNDLEEDWQGHVWIASKDHGLLEYDGKTAKHYFTGENERGAVQQLCLDQNGNVYVGLSNAGVYVRPAGGGEFRHIESTGKKHVSALYCCHDGRLMIGYDGMGVAIYHPATGQMEDNPYYSRVVDLSKSKVYSILEDTSGNIWLGLLQKGIFLQPKDIPEFQYLGYKLGAENLIGQACIVSTLIDSKGHCWVGTDKDGLYCLDHQQRLVRHYQENFPTTVMSLGEDASGRIWVGSYGEGFGYIDADGKNYHKYPQYPTASGFAIESTKNGEVWIATMGQGLLRLNPAANQLKAYTTVEKATTDRSVNSIVNDYISKMSLSPDGKRIYLATTVGACCLDIEKESWVSLFGKNCLNYGQPVRVVKEYGGRLWIGTNDGLYSYDLKKQEMQHFTTEKGLADNGIASIEQDKRGRLWLSTDHGLCCHDPKTGLTQSYFVDNGLQSNEFSDGASCAVDRGDHLIMVFGGVGGITWFDPDKVKQNEWKATVRLTGFTINGEQVNSSTLSDGYQVCDTTVIAADHFELSYRDNSFAIQLSTLTYDNPEHITYRYSINGEPFARLQPGVNEITFSHLPPGIYRFSVKAERNGQATPERTFTVKIHAPWYRTFWAYLFYVLALAAIVGYYLWQRRRKEEDRLRLQEHIHAEEMGEAKLRFFINISHEIRTPMTLILTPLLTLIKQDKDPQRQSIYETIRRNAERILSLINQMMDLRKIDKGQMQMRMSETDLVSFVGDIHSLFEHQARAKQISLTYEHDSDQLPVWIDRRQFDKVIVNILSNAFKFTPPEGTINISVTHTDKEASIAISDNGEQIPADKLLRIFDRFYQTPSSVNDRNVGTGVGLDLARSLVELHYGQIEARNLEQGCEFVVTIPLGCEHLKEDEMVTEPSAPSEAAALGLADVLDKELQSADDAAPAELEQANRQVTIVLAEDDDEIRDYLNQELSQNYQVFACTNGKEALAQTLRTLPDLVLSDVMMPEMDGNVLTSTLKSNPQTGHIPVVLLTAKSRDEDKLEGLESGADAYILKPFNMDILKRTIANLISSRRQLKLKYGRNDELEQQVDDIEMKSPDDKLLERIMNVINKNLKNSDLSVDAIADAAGISRVHLHRKMKELTGQTPHDFIRNIRLKQAAHLLARGDMNVTEVMYACGFGNAASFSTIFKRFYGMSPREYMNEHNDRKK